MIPPVVVSSRRDVQSRVSISVRPVAVEVDCSLSLRIDPGTAVLACDGHQAVPEPARSASRPADPLCKRSGAAVVGHAHRPEVHLGHRLVRAHYVGASGDWIDRQTRPALLAEEHIGTVACLEPRQDAVEHDAAHGSIATKDDERRRLEAVPLCLRHEEDEAIRSTCRAASY
jgi:hypothetical protein